MSGEEPQTFDLLERWRTGDTEALGLLLDRDMDWIRGYVSRHLGEHLRQAGDTDDFVQEAALAVLKYGPRFVITSRRHFRGLLGKIVSNVLRARHRELFALKRTPEQEKALGSDSVLYLDPPQQAVTRPDARVAHAEEREWVRLGLKANTARMRRSRAAGRLTKVVLKLKCGQIADLVDERPDEEARSTS